MSQQRFPWQCPGCGKSYSVPTIAGLTLCPACATGKASKPVATRRPGRAALIAAAVAILLASTGGIFLLSGGSAGGGIQQDPDKAKVERWLRENLDSGKWEEVQWWPAVEFGPVKREGIAKEEQAIEQIRREIADLSESIRKLKLLPHSEKNAYDIRDQTILIEGKEQSIDLHKESCQRYERLSRRKLCGIKIRTINGDGTKSIREEMFDVGSEFARRIPFDPEMKDYRNNDPDNLQAFGWEYLKDPRLQR